MSATHTFSQRHIGPSSPAVEEMLHAIGESSLESLIEKTVPTNIRLQNPLELPVALSEDAFLEHMGELAEKNQVFTSHIGLGYYNCITPPVIQRNILENPGWYTAYTPYQSEISQGRLEGLLNFQTMVIDLTGMEIANASLLDEATAAGEAMIMLFHTRSREAVKKGANAFFASKHCMPQTIEVLRTRARSLGIDLVIDDEQRFEASDNFFGALLQYPHADGAISMDTAWVQRIKEQGIPLVVAADLLSLCLLQPPGEWGADIVVGSTQRFGIPMGYGGPHAAYFATKEAYKRNIPGRIIGVSKDRHGKQALRMALQTREQHIRRDKATSNICTAQALLAIMAGMYAVYHGSEGLRAIANRIHRLTVHLSGLLDKQGIVNENEAFFDTLKLRLPEGLNQQRVREVAESQQVNFRYIEDGTVGISLDETTQKGDLEKIINIFDEALGLGKPISLNGSVDQPAHSAIPASLKRTSPFLEHSVFQSLHSETELMRYIKRLENKDISLTHSMIPLGSCTMKLNAAAELMPISMAGFAHIHPFAPLDQVVGYQSIIQNLGKWLCDITGFDAISFQPNSGAQGEYAGLMVIKAFHESNGDAHRDVVLIPSSAHGTNPASAVAAGLKVVVVKCDEQGNIDVNDLREKAAQHADALCALMVTYPSTHGVFESSIKEVTDIIHQNGGQVYMDGANMNAQVGLTNPATIGADVCHLNLHKTFAIPHGGGGPGMGPIAVAAHLGPLLPQHTCIPRSGEGHLNSVSAAPWGSALILLISYGYIYMLGKQGVVDSTKVAILNANYIKNRLSEHFDILYVGENGTVAHEMILDCRNFKKTAKVEVEDIAKRLIDYGFHAPTVSFPVAGTLMVEPTESESKEELDRFCDALISIRKEIEEIENGHFDEADNVLKQAPHTAEELCDDTWAHAYPRSKAAFPLEWIKERKYWSPVGRVDNVYGDRNLVCACTPVENYADELA